MRTTSNFRFGMTFAVAMCLLIPLLAPYASQPGNRKTSGWEQRLPSRTPLMPAHYDARRHANPMSQQGPSDRQWAALAQLQQRIKGLEIRFNPMTGTPRHLFSLSQRLTTPRLDDPVTIACDFLKTHQALFRLENREIDDLVVVKNYRTQHTGVTHLVFQQFYGGLPVFEGGIKINIDPQGRILSVSGNFVPGITVSLRPALSAADAVQAAVQRVAADLSFKPLLKAPAEGIDQATVFERGSFTQDVTATLRIFPAHDGGRLAWNVRLNRIERRAWYNMFVDARTGEILYIHNLYKFSEPQGLVFEAHPDHGPQVLKSFTGDPIASPQTWVAALPNTGTRGNNVITFPLARNAQQHFGFPFNNLYNTEGVNKFDLEQQTLRFTPNAAGGYDAELLPLSFDSNLGTNFTSRLQPNRDDGFFTFALGFAFPFFKKSFTTAFVNANGNVTFTRGSQDASESWVNMILGYPRIAALWDDLNPGFDGGVFVKRAADRVTITWNEVPQLNDDDSNTAQLRLFADGRIEIAFNGVQLTDGSVGLTRGDGDFDLRAVDFSATAPLTGMGDSLAEKFPTVELDVAITNLFYHLNFMHDYLYKLGFDEEAGNFQMDNFGRGGLGDDPVWAWPQDVTIGDFNNAFFGTPEDGQPAITGYLFFTNPPFRQIDASFDADVIYHEYVHGLTNRLVGGPLNISVLNDVQSDAMGEGWSDIYSVSITGDPITGEYSTGNRETGIRRVNYAQSPLRYGDFGNRFGSIIDIFSTPRGSLVEGGIALDKTFIPEEHDDGEIWASVLWDMRTALGKEMFEPLITDALKFTPVNPSMLDGRDAILLADVAAHEGRHQRAIWAVFAARGMGLSARADNGDDTIVFQAFDTPFDPLSARRETIFFDNMESRANRWTVEGDDGYGGPALWHQSSRRAASGSTAWYYGDAQVATYETGARNFGALTSPAITLPTNPPKSALVLEFDHFMRSSVVTGLPDTLLDNGHVRIIDAATGEIKQVALVNNNTLASSSRNPFQHEEIDISEFVGRTIQIQFYFDEYMEPILLAILQLTLSDRDEGWYIDNVRISRRAASAN